MLLFETVASELVALEELELEPEQERLILVDTVASEMVELELEQLVLLLHKSNEHQTHTSYTCRASGLTQCSCKYHKKSFGYDKEVRR